MNRSDTIGALSAALAKAQGMMSPAKRDSQAVITAGGKTRTYASLAAVWEAIREPLASNELAISQVIVRDEDGLRLETLLSHESGEWRLSEFPLPRVSAENTMQVLGSMLSYARRYSLSAIVGVSTGDDDDDAAQAAGIEVPQKRPVPGAASAHKPRSPDAGNERAAANNELARALNQVGINTADREYVRWLGGRFLERPPRKLGELSVGEVRAFTAAVLAIGADDHNDLVKTYQATKAALQSADEAEEIDPFADTERWEEGK